MMLSFALTGLLCLFNCCLSFRGSTNLVMNRFGRTSHLLRMLCDSKEDLGRDQLTNDTHSAWVPFAIIEDLDPLHPSPIEVLGEKFVIWRNPRGSKNEGWSIGKDLCPHQLAPLSKGRIDKATGCLECPYHGWQFDQSGKCARIPKADTDSPKAILKQTDAIETRDRFVYLNMKAYPVHIMGGILWGYLPIVGLKSMIDKLPEDILPLLSNEIDKWEVFSRELPYSFDIAMENFMDPSHIPFAHHALLGKREDGSPIPTQVMANESCVQVKFKDRFLGKERTATSNFISPFYFYFEVLDEKATLEIPTMQLMILVCPVLPGRTRVFIYFPTAQSKRPKILQHYMSMRFLDSDMWIMEAERALRCPVSSFDSAAAAMRSEDRLLMGLVPQGAPNYVVPFESDKGPMAWRKWWRNNMASMPAFGSQLHRFSRAPLSLHQKRDWFDFHGKHCRHCRSAMKQAEAIQRYFAPMMFLVILSLSETWGGRIISICLFFVLQTLAVVVLRMTKGPKVTEALSASQLFE